MKIVLSIHFIELYKKKNVKKNEYQPDPVDIIINSCKIYIVLLIKLVCCSVT